MNQNLAREAQSELKISQGAVDSLQVQNYKEVINFLVSNSLCGKHIFIERTLNLRWGETLLKKRIGGFGDVQGRKLLNWEPQRPNICQNPVQKAQNYSKSTPGSQKLIKTPKKHKFIKSLAQQDPGSQNRPKSVPARSY